MKKIISIVSIVAMLICALQLPVSAETLGGTLIRSSAADPWICYDDGYYYLTVTGTSRIAVFKSRTIAGFKSQSINSNIAYVSAQDQTVVDLYGEGATLSGTWSPEIHYFTEEEAGVGNSGWYMFLGLRNNTGDSSQVQAVVMKSLSGTPKGPYGHPVTGELYRSQPFSNPDGTRYTEWAVGQSVLKISEGEYKGIYTTWVTEIGRGQSGAAGKFYQKLMIAKMKNPWTIESEPGVITTPTQNWEYAGASSTHPRVVEGATALYGTRGDVYITYSGSGYWSTYGIGQLTWTGDDPLKTSSWVKLSDTASEENPNCNPIFQAKPAHDLYGCGHASFVHDKTGKGFLVYHCYTYIDGKKSSGRSAYIEPFYIDYTQYNGASYGVIHMGAHDDRMPAPTSTVIDFASTGEDLGVPELTAVGGESITLSLSADNAQGYTIYRSDNGESFNYLTTVEGTSYTDSAVEEGKTYYYRAYAYREQELSGGSSVAYATVQKAPTPPTLGDVDCDGALTSKDVTLLIRYLSGYSSEVSNSALCDIDGNGRINNRDAISLIREISEM